MKKIMSLVLLLAITVLPNAIFFASDDNVGFDFSVLPNQNNNFTSLRYRQTTNTHNQWKVDLTDSWECDTHNDGCITTFWLEHSDGTNVSHAYDLAENNRVKYSDAYSSASESNVRLTARNNNYNNTTYRIKGYWDEETN